MFFVNKKMFIFIYVTNLNKFRGDDIKYDSFREFFNSLYIEYQQILDHRNDS